MVSLTGTVTQHSSLHPLPAPHGTPTAPSRGPQHVGVGASGEAGSLDMMQGREPANAADQDAATRTASSSASGPSVSSSRSPDGPTATHSEADPEMAGRRYRKEGGGRDVYCNLPIHNAPAYCPTQWLLCILPVKPCANTAAVYPVQPGNNDQQEAVRVATGSKQCCV
jgi:hypothetical protein